MKPPSVAYNLSKPLSLQRSHGELPTAATWRYRIIVRSAVHGSSCVAQELPAVYARKSSVYSLQNLLAQTPSCAWWSVHIYRDITFESLEEEPRIDS